MSTVAPAPIPAANTPAPRRIDRADVWWMVGLGLLALALRLWFVLSVGQRQFSFNDAEVYNAIATNLAHGHGFRGVYGQPTAQWPPGYPFSLSLIYRVFGTSPTAGEVLNAILGAATVPLLYITARRTLGRVEAIAVGIGMTVMVGQIIWTDVLISETLFAFELALLLAVLATVAPERPRSAVIAGVIVGAATLTRGEGLLLAVFPLATWWQQLARPLWRRQLVTIAAMVLLFVVPWTIRNASAMHSFIPVSSNFSSTFWSGHNPKANGGPVFPSDRLLSEVKAPVASPQREIEISNLLRSKALSWMESHPFNELQLIPAKLIQLGSGDGQAIFTWIDAQASRGHPILSSNAQTRLVILGDVTFYLLLASFFASLLVFGTALWRRRPILRGPLAYLAIAVVLYGFVFYGGFRYHAALEPLMLLVAAPLLARLWAMRGQRLSANP